MLKHLISAVALLVSLTVWAEPIRFGFISDAPYNRWERENLPALIDAMNAEALAFVIHAGDIKSSNAACTNEAYDFTTRLFQRSVHPVIYVPGDNEWVDCFRTSAPRHEPLERLNKLRDLFMRGETSKGQRTLPLTRQSSVAAHSEYREHARWTAGGALFLTLNVPGSDNNYFGTSYRTRDQQGPSAEYQQRMPAVKAWLSEGFDLARRDKLAGVLIVIHANPLFENWELDPAKSTYTEFLDLLRKETQSFAGQVVLMHGDTHNQHQDKPLRDAATGKPLANFRRVEGFGSPAFGWISVHVDSASKEIFRFDPHVWQDSRTAVSEPVAGVQP